MLRITITVDTDQELASAEKTLAALEELAGLHDCDLQQAMIEDTDTGEIVYE